MGELVRPGHVASGVNVGINCLQIVVGVHRALHWNTELFQPVTVQPGNPAYGANQLIEHDALFNALVFDNQRFYAAR